MKKTNLKEKFFSFFRKKFFKPLLITVTVLILFIAVALGIKNYFFPDSKTTRIGFEDIGELATQTAYTTQISETKDSREFFGLAIPFTQSHYIYSYDVTIKAGFNFKEIKWTENPKNHTINVTLPKAEILSSELITDSLKVYLEDESIFTQVSLEDNAKAQTQLIKNAENTALENGLLENARTNAETILTSFFGQVFDLEQYTINFTDK